jgi:pimeloyl-ACP methyl ester carboxylesterase
LEPVILIPGLACSARYFAAQIPVLWRFGPVTVARQTEHATMAALADDVLAAAPPRFALAGHSMGGFVAFEIMRRAPERVSRLALLDTSPRPEIPEQTVNRRKLMDMAEGGRFAEIADLLYPGYFHPSRHDDADLRALLRAMADDTGAAAFVRQAQAIIGRADSRPTLATIRCPTLVLLGEADQASPPDRSAAIAEGIAGARLVTIAGSGHMPTLERPDDVNAALVQWMSS